MEIEKKIENILDKYEKYYNPGIARLNRFLGPVLEYKTEGCYMTDVKGEKYLDFLGGHGTFNFGYKHPYIVDAVVKQLELIPMAASKVHLIEKTAELSEKLAKISPGELSRIFYCNSGTEAVEGAIKLARAKTRKAKIISTENAFHGKSMGSLSATGRLSYRKPFEPLLDGIIHIPYNSAAAIDGAIDDDTAAVILEPIQGEGGVIVPDDGYLKNVENICHNKDVLLILDEVQTGMGRTGYNFAAEHDDARPDILTMAKALGGGVMPVGAILATPEAFKPFEEDPFLHTSTFGGNPLACAAASAAIDVLINENLAERAKDLGTFLISELKKIKEKHSSIINEIRGRGLLVGIEFADEGVAAHIINESAKNKILVLHMLNNPKVVRIEPPLIIEREHINTLIKTIDNALAVY